MRLLGSIIIISSHILHTPPPPPLEQALSGLPDGSTDLPLTGNLSETVLVFSLVCNFGPKANKSEEDRDGNTVR